MGAKTVGDDSVSSGAVMQNGGRDDSRQTTFCKCGKTERKAIVLKHGEEKLFSSEIRFMTKKII